MYLLHGATASAQVLEQASDNSDPERAYETYERLRDAEKLEEEERAWLRRYGAS